jgi:predicted dehydrogenase
VEKVKGGEFGRILNIRGDMGFQAILDPHDRFLSSSQGGGVLQDLGGYAIQYATLITGSHPDVIKGLGIQYRPM